jgi:hypothetical protein
MQYVICSRLLRSNHFSFYFHILFLNLLKFLQQRAGYQLVKTYLDHLQQLLHQQLHLQNADRPRTIAAPAGSATAAAVCSERPLCCILGVCGGWGGRGLSPSQLPAGPTHRAAPRHRRCFPLSPSYSQSPSWSPPLGCSPVAAAAPRHRRLPRVAPPTPHPAHLAVDLEGPWWRREAEQQREARWPDPTPPLPPSLLSSTPPPTPAPLRGRRVRRASRPADRGAQAGGGRSHCSSC